MNTARLRLALLLTLGFSLSSLGHAESVWIDVRSYLEHKIDHIEGDIRIPHSDILEEVSEQFPDKTTQIHLYCASGVRSGKALNVLKEAGYTNVFNEGGIADARATRNIKDE